MTEHGRHPAAPEAAVEAAGAVEPLGEYAFLGDSGAVGEESADDDLPVALHRDALAG